MLFWGSYLVLQLGWPDKFILCIVEIKLFVDVHCTCLPIFQMKNNSELTCICYFVQNTPDKMYKYFMLVLLYFKYL